MKTIEQRMKALEEMIAEIHAHVVMGQAAHHGKPEFDRAIRALIDGDKKPLDLYLQCGGPLPELEGRSYKPYIPRKQTPVKLSGAKSTVQRGASSVDRQPTISG